MNNGIDLRREFDEFIDENGIWVLLHRTGRKLRCRCWSEKNQEADSRCMICGGSGWVSRIERHKIRHESAVQVISRPSMQEQARLGKMWVDAQNFYMKHDVHPKPGDYIYEVGWKGNKPTHLIQAYTVEDAYPMRGDRGRIEYWNMAAKGFILEKEFRNSFVRSIGSIKNYEFPG